VLALLARAGAHDFGREGFETPVAEP
jgi:hypothetical protein